MLKKLIKSGRWKLLSMVFTAITLIAVATTVTLELTGSFTPKKDPVKVNTEYNEEYFNSLEENPIDEALLQFTDYSAADAPDGKTAGRWLTGINMNADYATMITGINDNAVARARYFEGHALIVPERVNGSTIVGINLADRGTDINTVRSTTAAYSLLKMVKIPKNIKAIKEGSFYGMSSLEYLNTPFIGTARGSSGIGLNYTIKDVMDNGGRERPTSYPFGSMFGKPFHYTDTEGMWTINNQTSFWFKWVWSNDSKTSGTEGIVDYTDYKLGIGEGNSEVLGVKWQEISGDNTTENSPASPDFEFLLPRSLKWLIVFDDTIIGNNALTSCPAQHIEIPTFNGASLLFGNYALSECVEAKEIILPTKPNVSFRKGTFNMCQKLEKLILPPGLTDITTGMLYNALNLKILVMPASIISIGNGAFTGCGALERIALYSGNDSSKITGDYDADLANGVVLNSSYKFNLPAALRTIGANAFENCNNMNDLNVPATVQTIGFAAFAGCYNLEKVVLPFIGAHSDRCGGENAKHDCSLDALGGDLGFHGLFGWIFGTTGSVENTYQATQHYLNEDGGEERYTFYIPNKLTDITIRNESYISYGALQGLKSVKNLTINEEVGENITSGILNGCSNLQSLSISAIGSHLGDLFRGDEFENSIVTKGQARIPIELKTIVVTNQHTIPTGAFDNCTRIENVTIGNNTIEMQNAIFYNNENLTTLTIPFKGQHRGEFHRYYWWWGDLAIRNSVAWLFSATDHPNTYANRSIYWWWFRYIPNRLRSLTITDDTEIDTYSFRGFSSLESISITNVPNHIESYAFTGCSNLQELHIPYVGYDINRNGVKGSSHTLGYIFGSSAYEGSYPAEQYGSTFYIPEKLSIVKVGAPGREEALMSNKVFDHAFNNCKSITTIDFYDAYINDLGSYAFANCTNLSRVNYPNARFMHVGDYAFYKCPKVLCIEDFTPSTVTTIGNYSFFATSVGNKVQLGATKGELVLDKYTSIGDYAFGNCLQVEKVNIPSTLSHIGEGMFSGCAYLTDVTLTNNKNVSPYMFENCTSLEGIDLTGITSIPEGLLSGCSSLLWDTEYNNGLIYDQNTTYIGKYAFKGCSALDQFILNNALQTIDEGAFQGCKGIEYMTIPRETTTINPNGWIGCNDNFFFYVYEPEENWSKGWVTNWNCDYPVYVLGSVKDDVYTYVYDTTEKKFYITGLTPNATLNGVITIPHIHNGIQVVGIDESRRTEEDIAAGAKDIRTQQGITKVILPKVITKIVGSPFQTGFRVDIYTELTKDEVSKVYNDSYAALEKEFTEWKKNNPNASETQIENTRINIFSKIKGWLPFAEDRNGVCVATNGENVWDQRYWTSGGFLYYKDYWQYGTGVTFNLPYLNIANFKYTLSTFENHYTGNPIEQIVTQIQLVGELFENETIGVTRQLLFIGGRGGVEQSPQNLFKYTYHNNVNVGTATLEASVENDLLREFNRDYMANNLGAINHALYLVGKTNLHYKILKSKITVSSISGDIVTKTYDGKTYSYSTWAPGEISGLEGFPGARFTGRVETRSEDVGVYSSVGNKLYWASDWHVYLNGHDISSNFEVVITFSVKIDPMEVEIAFTRDDEPIKGVYQFVNVLGTYDINGKTVPLLEYPYIGGKIQPYGVAKNIHTGEVISKSLCPVVATHMDANQYGTYPYGTDGNRSTYGIYAYINGSAAKNYKLFEKQQDGTYVEAPYLVLGPTNKIKAIQAAYRVGKGLITIKIDEKYKISPTEDYWSRSWGWSGGLDSMSPVHAELDGIGSNSYFIGSLKTTKDELGVYNGSFDTRTGTYPGTHIFGETAANLITWDNLLPGGRFYHQFGSGVDSITVNYTPSAEKPFMIYNPTLKIADETKYYDVVVEVRIQILYNDFNPTYFIGVDDDQYYDQRNPNYIVTPTTITEDTDGNLREYEFIQYMVDGQDYKLTVDDLKSYTDHNPGYEVNYYADDGTSFGTEGPQFKEIWEYVYAVQLSGRHYNTLRKNIRLKTVKSNVIVAGLDKVYDREPISPLEDGKITKIGQDQIFGLTFTYYDANGNQLNSAPKNVGQYSVRIYAPEGQYFNQYDHTHSFKITKRKVYISVNGEKTFDQNVFSYTPVTGELATTPERPNEGILLGDEFVGTIQTDSFVPDTYVWPDDFIWSPNWAIYYSADNTDVSANYELVVRGSYKINPLTFVYEAFGYEGDYDGYFHTGTVNILYPTPDNYAPAFSPDVSVKWSVSSLDEFSSAWLDQAPVFASPGEYELYYMISAPYFKTVIRSVKIKINLLTIEYEDPATMDTDGDDHYWTLQYNGRSHTFEINVLAPTSGAKVTYSLDGMNYTAEAPMFINYGLHDVYYKIEAPNYKEVGPTHRVVRIKIDINDPDDNFEGKKMADTDYYANFFSGEYDGQEHSVDAGFNPLFVATVGWTRILYSLDDGVTWTEECPVFQDIGKYEVTVRYAAEGYKDEMLQGFVEITGLQLDIQTNPYTAVFNGKNHMITLSSNTAQLRYDDATKKYYYLDDKITEEVELEFYYTTDPNVVGSGSGWLPTVANVDGVPTVQGLRDVGIYSIYVRIEAEYFETLIIQEYTRLTITRLENPDITMDSPQQFEYSKAPIDSSKIVIDTVADGERAYYYYSAYWSNGEMKYDEPLNRVLPPEELGLYYVEVRISASKNCGSAHVFGFIEIVPRVLEVKYTNPQYYDGTLKTPDAYVVTGTSDVIHILSSVKGDKQPIEVGTYFFDVFMVENNPNYVLNTDVIEMEIKIRNLLFYLDEEHLLKENGDPWNQTDSEYYDNSAQVGDNKWHMLGDMSGTHTIYIDGAPVEIFYAGLAARHAIYAELETSKGVRGTYFNSNVSNEFYINSVIVKKFDIYEIDENGNFVLDADNKPISVKDYYDVYYYLKITLLNPDINLEDLDIINEYSYDGLPHTIQVNLPKYLVGGFIRFEGFEGNYSSIPPKYVNVGEYVIKYYVGANGYEDTYGQAILKINPAELNIVVNDMYRQSDARKTPHNVYDDSYHINDYTLQNILSTPMPKANHMKYYSAEDYTYDEILNFYKNFDPESPILATGLDKLMDAGSYFIVVYYEEDIMRWKESFAIVNVELKPRDIIIEIPTTQNFIKVYDGTKISIPLTDARIDMNRTETTGLCTNHTINQTADMMRQYTVQTNSADAGIYDLLTQFEFGAIDIRRTDGSSVDSKNYHPVIHGNFIVEIQKAYLKDGDFIVEPYKEKIYDGYRHEPDYTCVSDGELKITYYLIDDETGNETELRGDQKNVGHYRLQVSIGEGKNYYAWEDSFYRNDPLVTAPYLESEIVCTPKEVDVHWDDVEQTFNGESLSIKPWILDEETDHDNPVRVDLIASYWSNDIYDWIPTVINQGTYLSLASFDTTTSVGQTYDKNYTLLNNTEYFVILYLTLKIQLGDGGETNDIVYYNTQTNWYSPLYKEDTPNAAEIFAETPELIEWLSTITISSLADEGAPASISAKDYTPGTYRGDRFDVNCRIRNKHGVDVTSSINFEIIGSVTVKTDTIDYVTKDVTLPYKENKNQSSVVGYTFEELQCLIVKNPKSGFTIENFVINEVSYGHNFPNLSQAGEYDITFDIMATGYEACRGSVHITITQFPAYMSFSTNLSKTYDGSPVEVSQLVQTSASGFNGEVADLIIQYSELVYENGNYYEVPLDSAPTNVGKYKVHITSSVDSLDVQKNYTELDITQSFDITAKEIKLTVEEDMELLNDELLNKAWTSKQYEYDAGDNPYIMSGDLLQFQFSTDIFTRGNYVGSKILKVTDPGALDATNNTNLVTESGKIFNVSWRLVKTDDKGNIVYDEYEDPNNPTGPKIKVPRDVSTNYSINLVLKLSVHYPYIPVTVEGEEIVYDQQPHFGTIEFADYTSADISISYPADWFEANAVQLYSRTQDDLTNNPNLCVNNIELMSFTDPGTYTIYYKIDVKDNASSTKFESAIGSYVIQIDKLERTVTETQTLDKEFDNTATGDFRSGRYFPYYEVSYDDPTIADNYNIEDIEIIYKQAGFNSYISAEDGCIDAGVYMYSMTIPETKYYKQSVLQSNFIISKIRIYIEDKPLPSRAIFTYDGLVKSVSVTENSNYYNVGTKASADAPLDPLLDLKFSATLVTKDFKTKKYSGADTTLLLYNYEYTVTDLDGKDVSNNYLIDYSNASIEIIPIPMQYKVNHPVYIYDNQEHAFSYYISTPSNPKLVRVEWFDEATGEWTTNPIYKRNVGEYEVKIRMFADNYQPTGEITLPMTIEPAETIVEYVSNLSRVYDGNEVTIPEIIMTSRDDANEGTLVDRYTYKYYQYDENGNLIPEPIFTQYYDNDLQQIVTNGHRAINVGRYRMEIIIPASENFAAVTYSDDFTISSFVTDVTWQDLVFTYDGTPKAPTAYLQLVPTDKLNGQHMRIQIDVSVTPNAVNGDINHKNKGTYTATASLNLALSDPKIANYIIGEKTKNVTFVIQPRSTVITLNYPQSLYKGDIDYLMYYKGLNKEGYKFTASNIVPEHKITDYLKLNYDGPKEYNKPTDFTWMDGVNDVALANQKPRIYDENNVDVTDNYLLGYSYLFVLNEKITDTAVSITNYVGVYDGQYHSFDIDLLVDDPSQFTIKYWVLGQSRTWTTTKPRRIDVGQDQISVRIEDAQGHIVFEGTAGITITKADPEIQFEDLYFRLGKTYDGVPIVNPKVTYNGVATEAVTYTYYEIDENGNARRLNSNPINAGKYRLDVEVLATQNYNSVVHSFDIFEITPRTITIHIKTQTKLFDYLSWTHKVEDHEVENLVRGHTLRLDEHSNNGILMTSSPEVGEYTLLGVNPGFQWQNNFLRIYDANGNEVNSPTRENYVVNLLADVKIAERQFSVDFKDDVVLYDGQPHFISARLNGTVRNDGTIDPSIYADFENEVTIEYAILQNGTYSYGLDLITRVGIGVYNIRVRISAPNYETLVKEAYLAILDPDNPYLPPEITDPDDPNNPGGDPDDPNNPNNPDNPNWPGPDDADKFPYLEYDRNKIYDKLPYPDPIYTKNPTGNHVIQYYPWDYYWQYAKEHKNDNTVVLDPTNAISNPIDAGRYVFVFKIDENDLEFPGREFHQEFKVYPRPVDVTWSELNQQYLGGIDQLPKATYTDIDGNIINCTVREPQSSKGEYSVVASTDDTNYILNNPNATFIITENLIKDIVLVPPEDGYKVGDPIILEDTDGNKYIKQEDFEKDPSIVEDPNNTFIVDEDGNILKYDPEKDEWVDADLPFQMEIDDSYVDPDTGEHKVNVNISLKNPIDDTWENNGKDDIHYDFPLKPMVVPSDEYDLVFEYTQIWVYTGNPIEPEVTVYLRNLKTNEKTILDPKNYTIGYNNNVNVTTEDSLAEILFSSKEGSNYFFEDTTQYFKITASKPDILELKEDALIQFISAKFELGSAIIVEDGSIEHLEAGEKDIYLGHLHQETRITDILSQFKNNPERLIVTNHLGEEIIKEDYSQTNFGSGFTISLIDDDGQVIDSIQGILFGDLNSDGSIADQDLSLAQNYIKKPVDFGELDPFYYFTGVTIRSRGEFNDATIGDLQKYIKEIAVNPDADFNSFDGKYSNSSTDTPTPEVDVSAILEDKERYNL